MADVSKRGKRGARNLTPLEFSKAIQSYLAACSQPQQIDQKRRDQNIRRTVRFKALRTRRRVHCTPPGDAVSP